MSSATQAQVVQIDVHLCTQEEFHKELDGTTPPIHSRAYFWPKPFVDLHRVELVADTSGHRFCDMCLQCYARGGNFSMCTQECPSRRGLRRGGVTDDLVRGNIVSGLDPRGRLILEAQAPLMRMGQTCAIEIQGLQAQMAELENRIRICEQRRQEVRETLLRFTDYSIGNNIVNLRTNANQPETEP